MDIKIKAKLKAYTKGIIPTIQSGEGINVENKDGVYTISARQKGLTQEEFNELIINDQIEEDMTYFVVEESPISLSSENTETSIDENN